MKLSLTFTPPLEDRIAKLQQLAAHGIYESMGRLAQDAGGIYEQYLKMAAPVRTGALRDSIHYVQRGAGSGRISLEYQMLEYGRYVIEGTAPHDIYPVNGRALRFYGSDGSLVFAKVVHHPGTRANDFPKAAWDAARPEVEAVLSRSGREIAAEIVR